MEILEAYDLTGSFRRAGALAGCDHKTVAHWVAVREAAGGGLPGRARHGGRWWTRWPGRSRSWSIARAGRFGADQAHSKLVAMGYEGSERTTRRAVAEAKRRWRQKHGRRTRPWIPEPGLWLQWDYGEGPVDRGRTDGVVLRVAGVVAVSGGGAVARQDVAVGRDRAGPDAAAVRWRARPMR